MGSIRIQPGVCSHEITFVHRWRACGVIIGRCCGSSRRHSSSRRKYVRVARITVKVSLSPSMAHPSSISPSQSLSRYRHRSRGGARDRSHVSPPQCRQCRFHCRYCPHTRLVHSWLPGLGPHPLITVAVIVQVNHCHISCGPLRMMHVSPVPAVLVSMPYCPHAAGSTVVAWVKSPHPLHLAVHWPDHQPGRWPSCVMDRMCHPKRRQ